MPNKISKQLLTICMAGLISSCASSTNPNDPYENYNRKIFIFNMAVDHYVVRPVAVGYTYLPSPLRSAISNFYNNLLDFVNLGNDVLQLDGKNSMQTTMRIALNSTFGILGLIDVASSLGLARYKNTFGNTLRRFGYTKSNYLILPFLGPGTLRDDLGLIPDIYFNPLFYITQNSYISWGIFGINLINQRSLNLGQEKILMQSLDPYATIRDIYLQGTGQYQESDSNIDALLSEETTTPAPILITSPILNNNMAISAESKPHAKLNRVDQASPVGR